MAELSRTVQIIFQGVDNTSAALASVQGGLNGIGSAAGGAAPGLRGAADESERLGRSAQGIASLDAALKTLSIALVAKAFIDANVEVQRFEQAMTLVKGSTSAASAELEYVKGVADRLGVGVADVAGAWLRFSSAVQGTQLTAQEARTIFEGFGSAIARLGGSSTDVNGAIVQLTQGISKGKFELEDLKSIAERVPGFFDKFSTALGVTTAELFELISQGKVGTPEILKIGESLDQTFGGTRVEGYAAELERLRNSLDETFVVLGKSGAFDVLTKAVAGTAAAIAGATVTVETLGKAIGIFFGVLATGDFGNFAPAINALLEEAGGKLQGARTALLGVDEAAGGARTTVDGLAGSLTTGIGGGTEAVIDMDKETKKLNESLKAIGLDPKKLREGTEEAARDIIAAFDAITKNPAATGETIVTAFLASLNKLKTPEQLDQARISLEAAFGAGKISADQLTASLVALSEKQDGTTASQDKGSKSAKAVADETKRAADEAKRAEEATQKYKIRLEELASNERIKAIEARVSINVAEIEADTKKVIAAFESISATVESTGDVIGTSLGLLKDSDQLSSSNLQTILGQIDLENKRRDEALQLQKRLTEAQIESLKARTRAMEKGDAMIKIEGDGLQPHLEAFMWEILRTIQVRVNRDGLEMLTGV